MAMDAIVIVDRFPNVYESYVLNQIEYTMLCGGTVSIISGPQLGRHVDRRVAQYDLISRCHSQSPDSLSEWARVLSTSLNPFLHGPCISRGLLRLHRSGATRGFAAPARLRAVTTLGILGSNQTYDVVHAHNMRLAYRNLFVSRALRIPLIVSFHGLQTTDLERPFFLSTEQAQEVFNHVAIVTAGTRYARSILLDLGCPSEKIRLLPVGIPLEAYPYRPTSFDGSRRVRILTVARLSPEKSHSDVIAAIQIARKCGWDVEYRIVGNGPYRETLERLIVDMDAANFVHMVGEKCNAELIEEYGSADIFVLASKKEATERYYGETQGLVIQEAMASGKLVVATEVGGIPECVEDGKSAFLVPEGNPARLAEAIMRLLESPRAWGAWQHAGRDWVEKHFSMDVLGPRLMEVYHDARKQA